MVGDTADNIKGAKGIGEKGADKALEGISEDKYKCEVLQKYCEIFGDNKGIEEFYKNYKTLYIVDEYDNVPVPNFVEINKEESESTEGYSTERREC
jgi:5'-3' exonuclease